MGEKKNMTGIIILKTLNTRTLTLQGHGQYIYNRNCVCRDWLCKKEKSHAHENFLYEPFLTIRKGTEHGYRAEAAITSHGACPDLDIVLSGPAEVSQYSLVSVTLCVVAVVLSASLLPIESRISSAGIICIKMTETIMKMSHKKAQESIYRNLNIIRSGSQL